MGANISRASKQENVSTTLSAGITDIAATMDVSDASKLNYPSYLVIDRVDASGTLKSTSLWEYVKVTNIVGNTLTITRAQGGSTGQSHSSGAVVEAVMTAALQEEYYAAFNPEHTATGGHVMSTATIAYLENARMAVSSVASISLLRTNSLNLINLNLTSTASIAQANIPQLIVANPSITYVNSTQKMNNRARAYLSAAQLNITNNTWTKVLLNAETYDTGDDFASYKYTAPVTGYYLVIGSVSWVSASVVAAKEYGTAIYVNGALVAYTMAHASLAATLIPNVSDILYLTKDQYVELYCYNNSGVDTCDVSGGTSATFLAVHLLSV